MNLKEFLNPAFEKMILFLLFLLILPVFYAQSGEMRCIVAPCPQPFSFMPFILAVFSYKEYYRQGDIILNSAIGFVCCYLLSCLIVYAYNKLRKVISHKKA